MTAALEDAEVQRGIRLLQHCHPRDNWEQPSLLILCGKTTRAKAPSPLSLPRQPVTCLSHQDSVPEHSLRHRHAFSRSVPAPPSARLSSEFHSYLQPHHLSKNNSGLEWIEWGPPKEMSTSQPSEPVNATSFGKASLQMELSEGPA